MVRARAGPAPGGEARGLSGAPPRARQAGLGSALPSGRVTFVFTDIEGSTRLLAQLRDRYADVLERHAALVRSAAERNGGVEVDTQGDSFFLAFGSAADAAGFAAEASRALRAEPWPGGMSVLVRIGLHTGEARIGATGYVGMDVHRAARIAAAAHGGQVVLSGTTASELDRAEARVAMRDIGSYRLKDLPGAEPIWQLDWDGVATEFPPLRTLDAPESPPEPGEAPFQGLEAFDVVDADRFFGRDALTGRLLDHLRERPVLAVVGASGSGKSSMVRAGIVATVLRDPATLGAPGSWACRLLTPGADPPASLSAALAPPPPQGTGLLLVVDQLEELYTLCDHGGLRASFADRLLELVGNAAPIKLVVTLRADFYHRLAEHAGLRDAVAASQAYIGPMTRAELRRAIEGPAEHGDWTLVPGLVDLLVHDTGDEPGALPLLSHALLETWNRRRGRTMTLKGYTEAGGVAAAIARTADRVVLETFGPEQQAVARRILLRLTEPGEGTRDTRRRATLEEVVPAGGDAAAVAAVVEALAAARLVTVGDNSLEVAHEALIEEWPTLREWLEEDREGQRTHRRLTDAAREWARLDRDPELLARGSRLAQLTEWAEAHAQDLNDEEAAFVEASVRLRDAEAEQREARTRRELEAAQRLAETEHRAARRLRRRAAVLGVALVVAVGAMGVAVWQQQAAERASARARSGELVASALASLDEDPTLSKLLALAAASAGDPSLETIVMLHQAMAADRVVDRYDWPVGGFEQLWTDLHPSGRTAVASGGFFSSMNHALEVVDLMADAAAWSWSTDEPAAAVGRALFTPEGDRVVAGVFRHPLAEAGVSPSSDVLGVYVWEAATGALIARHPTGPCGSIVADVGPSQAVIATWDAPRCMDEDFQNRPALELLDLATGRRDGLAEDVIPGDPIAVLTPDGRYVAYDRVTQAGNLTVVRDNTEGVDVATFDHATIARQQHHFLRDLSPDGSRLLYGDVPVHIRDVGSDDAPVVLQSGTIGATFWAEFDTTGRTVVGLTRNGTLQGWDAGTGGVRFSVGNAGLGRAQMRGSAVLVTRQDTPTALLMDVGPRGEVGALDARALADFTPAVAVSDECFVGGDALRLALGRAMYLDTCTDGYGEANTHVVNVSDPANPSLAYSLQHGGGQRIAISPDGRRFARQDEVGNTMGSIKIRDAATGDELVELDGICRAENSATAPNPENQGDCLRFPDAPFPIWAWQLRWSPDGSMIAAVDQGAGGFVAVWSAIDGRLLTHERVTRDRNAWDVIFSPDSSRLLISLPSRGNTPAVIQDVSAESWQVERSVQFADPGELAFAGFVDGGRTLLGITELVQAEGSALFWFDATSLELSRPSSGRIHDGSVKAAALSSDGGLIATGDSGGTIRVRATTDGRLVHEVRLGETEVQGVAFLNDRQLAVTTRSDGALRIFTVDPDELIEIVRRSLTRGFTERECEQFGFGADCPTLDELRGG